MPRRPTLQSQLGENVCLTLFYGGESLLAAEGYGGLRRLPDRVNNRRDTPGWAAGGASWIAVECSAMFCQNVSSLVISYEFCQKNKQLMNCLCF